MGNELRYTQILSENQKLDQKLSSHSYYHITILSNIVVFKLQNILEYFLRHQGIRAKVEIGEYDNLVQESVKAQNSDLVIIFWELMNIQEGFAYTLANLSQEDKADLVAHITKEIDFLYANLKNIPLVVINKFSLSLFSRLLKFTPEANDVVDQLNQHLVQHKPNNVIILDTDSILMQLGIEQSFDERYFYTSKAPFTIDFFKEYAQHIVPVVSALRGKAKKVLVLDCDNTLWKGVVGEDGAHNVDISVETPEGRVFRDVQFMAMELHQQGVVLALCSKNNLEDVEEAFLSNEDMVLKSEHILIKRINWEDKVSNLKSIAQELNVGLDSLVFVDDSEFEINFVKDQLPEVSAFLVPNDVFAYPQMIRDISSLFLKLNTTQEDQNRIQSYQDQQKREEFQNQFKDMSDYLESLELELTISCNDCDQSDRLAQMTQKTNQFNLTTKRYTQNDIERFIKDNQYDVFSFKANDKFGDYGITGLCVVQYEQGCKRAIIDSFLMSCRVIGRNLEKSFFDAICQALLDKGIEECCAYYEKTIKNQQVESFYDQFGFNCTEQSESNKTYTAKLSDLVKHNLEYIKVKDGIRH